MMAKLVPVDHDPFAAPAAQASLPPPDNPGPPPVALPPLDASAPQEQPSIGEDIAKSAAIGVPKGVISLLGAPGEVGQMASGATDWAADKLGVSPETTGQFKENFSKFSKYNPFLAPFHGPGSKEIQEGVEKHTGEFYKPKTVYGDYAQTITEMLPAMATGPGGVLRRAVMQTILPGAAAETAGQLTKGTEAEPWARAGAALATPAAASRLITPFKTSPGRAAMVQELKNEGVSALSAGQKTGNKMLRYGEGVMGDYPLAGGKATAQQERAGQQFTSAVLDKIGMPKDIAPTPSNVADHVSELQKKFETLSARNTLRFDPQFSADITATMTRYGRKLPTLQREVVNNVVADLSSFGRTMPGTHYQTTRSDLSKMARAFKDRDPVYADALRGIRNALDDSMGRSISAADRAEWKTTRRQYENWKTIENLVKNTDAQGNVLISPANLKNAASSRNRGLLRGDYASLARAGDTVMKALPESGTQPRALVAAIPTALAAGLTMDPIATLAAASAPVVTGRAIMSKAGQKYLGNRMMPRGSQDEERLAAFVRSLLAAKSTP